METETTATFSSLGLSPEILQDIRAAGYAAPTPIQALAIPPALEGRDVVGCAQTGTGKTAAFVIPLVERLAGTAGTGALILAPTRELALQTQAAIDVLGRRRGVRAVTVIGGLSMAPQTQALRTRPAIVVATPGRLLDHLDRGTVRLEGLRILVLDEADRMLDMGFAPQIDRILGRLPRTRQTLLFSATIPEDVAALTRAHLRNPAQVTAGRRAAPVAGATQRIFLAGREEKTPLLLRLLRHEGGRVLVFTRTKHRADRVARAVGAAGHRVERIHGNRSQAQRQDALAGFRSGAYRVLVATDIAARGIDVSGVAHVVNYDLPGTFEDYVHRIGRTARAQATGHASSFVAPDERDQLRTIERMLGAPVPRAAAP
jgi:ATP-dependent RNA helicase RhlE